MDSHEQHVQEVSEMTRSRTLRITGRYYRYYPWHDPLGEAEEELELDLDRTVFLLVDVYGARHDPEWIPPSEVPEFYKAPPDDQVSRIIREKIAPARAAAKRAGLRRVYLTNYLSPGLSEGNEWRNMSMRTCGVDVLEEWKPPTPILEHAPFIAPEPDEPLVPKQLYSGFFETHLDSVLRGYGAKNLVVVGFDSRICLGTTVTDALYRDYRVIVLRDATATNEFPETREGQWANFLAIRHIEANVGYTSLTEQFIRACDEVAAGSATDAGDAVGAESSAGQATSAERVPEPAGVG
jgi:nicotinamidase-related amidase